MATTTSPRVAAPPAAPDEAPRRRRKVEPIYYLFLLPALALFSLAITLPAIMPVSVTLVLIRVIEAFKIVDLPNILTNGGPGIASESMTLHAFMAWRTLDLGGSAAIAYMLLLVTTFFCVAFANLTRQRAAA